MEASDTVEELLTLQDIDSEIHRIETELEAARADVAELQANVDELEQQAAAIEGRREEAEERLRKFQRAVQAGRATLKRLEARSAEVTNMQQHFAVRSETDAARRNLRIAEEDALDAMQDIEQAASELSELQAALDEARTAHAARATEAGEQEQDLGARLTRHRSEKQDQQGRIDRKTLQLYESVSRRRTSPLAELTADGVCGNCYTAIPLQRQANIRNGRDLAVCEGCGVILHGPVEAEIEETE